MTALGIHYKFVVLSAPPPSSDSPAQTFVRRMMQKDQAVAFATLRRAQQPRPSA